MDLVIRNASLLTPNGFVSGGIGVQDGRIAIIASDANLPKAGKTIEANGQIAIPGLLDTHVHFRSPEEEIEGFKSGSRAAASVGITTVFDMPGSNPGVISRRELFKKIKSLADTSIVDYALYAGAGSQNLGEIDDLASAGAIAFKTFMTSSTSYHADDDGSLYEILERVGKTGKRSCIHAENQRMIELFTKRLQSKGRNDPSAHSEARPNLVEAEAILKAVFFSRYTSTSVHIVHMSTYEGVEIVVRSKKRGYNISVETCPQYLVLDKNAAKKHGPYAKVNPPLRETRDQEALWEGLRDGTIDMITSDHAPHPKERKDIGWTNIWEASSGNPGIEAMPPIMFTEVNKGRISLERLVDAMSTRPAKLFDLFPKKGALKVGSDADIVLVDMKREGKLEADKLHTKARDAFIYDGWNVKGLPTMTMVRGKIVMENGEIIGSPGWGEFLTPSSKQQC